MEKFSSYQTRKQIRGSEVTLYILQESLFSFEELQKVKFFMPDAGYDQLKNYEAARNVKAQAIIPMNLRNEKESPAGTTSSGTPCYSMGIAMTSWGRMGIT